MHHVLAVPSRERKVRVLAIAAAFFGCDIVSPASVQHPSDAFVAGGEPSRNAVRPIG